MALAVGPYGIEYDPESRNPGSPGLRRLVAFIFTVAAISLVVTLVRRTWFKSALDPVSDVPPPVVQEAPQPKVVEPPPAQPEEPPPEPIADPVVTDSRPPRVRNLLMRLDEAEKRRDVAMAVTTIEQICSLPGDPAYDLYDKLYRRAGELNIKWLFEERNAQWVTAVKVKAGDSASRIASRYGSTLASLKRLNPKLDIDRLRIGATVYVMSRPRFNLIVKARPRTADLQLNGRFFKRYDLRDDVTGAVGAYETTVPLRKFLAEKGIWFNLPDRTELETLIPKSSLLVISEL